MQWTRVWRSVNKGLLSAGVRVGLAGLASRGEGEVVIVVIAAGVAGVAGVVL